jgi:hypothetical protein
MCGINNYVRQWRSHALMSAALSVLLGDGATAVMAFIPSLRSVKGEAGARP